MTKLEILKKRVAAYRLKEKEKSPQYQYWLGLRNHYRGRICNLAEVQLLALKERQERQVDPSIGTLAGPDKYHIQPR